MRRWRRAVGLPGVEADQQDLLPEGAEAQRLAEVVRRCPSGALRYELVDGLKRVGR
ncbi:(4Fe-4S)-binding protein [Streptomyces sp. NPDC006645]|uniref:(4Fe-4S)-binding protein n=1 Tax=Streptomyces sp. NPDC006645 TaxID=3157184 RepID=UPI0033BD5243